MDISIVNTDVPLLLSPSFVSEVEGVIDRNVDSNVPLVALFISRLIKGLQNLSKCDGSYTVSWGDYSYVIEDIGTVHFKPLMDSDTGEKAFHLLSIQWSFATSRFFSEMKY